MNIYNKIKENLKLTIYGYTDELRDSSGDTTNTSKSQITNVLTPYITQYDSTTINSKKYRFQIPDILKYKILPENCRLFVNAFTLPLLELVPHDIILRMKTNENNYFDNLSNDDSIILCSYTYNPAMSSIVTNPLTPSDVTTSTTTSSTDSLNITTNITTTTRIITLSGSTQTITTVQTSRSDFTQNLQITEDIITYPLKVSGVNNDWFYSFANTSSINFITFLKDTKCDVMIVGGGGDGGIGGIAGGGGSGEICIKYDYIFTPGTYNITVGNKNQSSLIGALFSAKPGGIGGSYFTLQNVIKDQIIPANSFYRINNNNFTSIAAGTYRIDFNTDPGVIKIQSLNPLTDIQDRSYGIVNSPMAWYKFDVSGNLGLDTQGLYNLTAYNTPTFNTSDYTKGSGSVNFDGTNYFEVANTGQFSPDSFSICCWCKIVQGNALATIASCRNPGNFSGYFILCNSNNLEIGIGNGTAFISSGGIFLNFAASTPVWRHLVVTMNKASNSFIVYVNGVLLTSLTRTYVNSVGISFRIGTGTYTSTSILANGSKLDDFRFYDRVLTAAEVANIYHGTIDIYTLPSNNGGGAGGLYNPMAWYKFDVSNNLILDSQGTYNLTAYNSPTFDTSDYIKGNGSVVFNGTNYFEVANTGQFSPDDFSICCWCKIVQKTGYQSITSCRNQVSTNWFGWMVYVNNNNLDFFTGIGANGFSNAGGTYNNFAASTPIWRHLVITMKKSTSSAVIYINGVLHASVFRTYVNNTGTNIRIGCGNNNGTAFEFLANGSKIDDFRFYNRVITAAEVTAIYNDNSGIQQVGGILVPTATNPTGTTSYYGAGYDGTFTNGGQGGENPTHSYNIYGSALNLGYAGLGSTSSSFVPNVKSTYGSGGDGNGGLGTQGLVVFRFDDIDTTSISVSSVTVLQPTTTIYTPQAVSNVKNEYFINSFKIPRNFFSKGFIEMELMTLLNTNITFEKSQLDRLMLDLIIYEEEKEITEDNVLAPQVDLNTLSYNIKSDLY